MPVYIIQAGETPNVKLGWADRDVEARRRDLQCAHYLPLRVIRIIEGPRALESWLHRYFAAYRGVGEWFTFQPEMLTVSVGVVAPNPTETLFEALGGTPTVSVAAGVAQNTVTYWERRERIPPEHWDALIALATERKVKGVDHALMLALHRPRKPRSDRPQTAVTA